MAGGPAAAAEGPKFKKSPPASVAAKLHMAESASSERIGTKIYIVQMAADPAMRYQGGLPGFARTAPEKGERYDARTSQVQMYAEQLGRQQDALLAKSAPRAARSTATATY